VRRLEDDTVLVVRQVGVIFERVIAGRLHVPPEQFLELFFTPVVPGKPVVASSVDLHVVCEVTEEGVEVPANLRSVYLTQQLFVLMRHRVVLLVRCLMA
jgi:hypothetical protein